MDIEYDEEKRAKTLMERGLDFANARELFGGRTSTVVDDRIDYGEVRFQTIGYLRDKVIAVVWTPRGGARRIISMRECNVREREKYRSALD